MLRAFCTSGRDSLKRRLLVKNYLLHIAQTNTHTHAHTHTHKHTPGLRRPSMHAAMPSVAPAYVGHTNGKTLYPQRYNKCQTVACSKLDQIPTFFSTLRVDQMQNCCMLKARSNCCMLHCCVLNCCMLH